MTALIVLLGDRSLAYHCSRSSSQASSLEAVLHNFKIKTVQTSQAHSESNGKLPNIKAAQPVTPVFWLNYLVMTSLTVTSIKM